MIYEEYLQVNNKNKINKMMGKKRLEQIITKENIKNDQ